MKQQPRRYASPVRGFIRPSGVTIAPVIPSWLQIALLVLWSAWVVQVLLSIKLYHKWLTRLRQPVREKWLRHTPEAAVIVPFKGLEPGLAEHLHRLTHQNYPRYSLVWVVQSEDDPAWPALQEAAGVSPVPVSLVVAGLAPDDTGQKVHNMLKALESLGMGLEGDLNRELPTAVVCADSDAAPDAGWLAALVAPLLDVDRTAWTTGYRWLVPVPGEGGGVSIPSRLASALNGQAAAFQSLPSFTHAWGGSMAILTQTARDGDLLAHWQGALSDDYQAARMARELGKRVYFVPTCLVASPVDLDRHDFANFTHRQHLITRLHAPWTYWGGVAITGFYTAAAFSATVATSSIFWNLVFHGSPGAAAGMLSWIGGAVLLTVVCLDLVRQAVRDAVVRRTLGPHAATSRPFDRILQHGLLITPLHLLLLLRASVGRTISWRGIEYRIDGPQRVRRVG